MKAHLVDWTPERIKRFFDHYESQAAVEDNYFGRQRGRAVLRFARGRAAAAGPALDVGCGPGFFLDHLLDAGIACAGADVSPASARRAVRRLSGRPGFMGAAALTDGVSLPFGSTSFRTAFLMETLEHIPPEKAGAVLREIRRVLEPGGLLVVTTPYKENLAAGALVCPFCGCSFHEVQHVASFDEAGMDRAVLGNGFRTVVRAPALLLPDWGVWLRAQVRKSAWEPLCPECGRTFPPPRRGRLAAFLKRVRELRHLVGIYAAV